MLAQNELLTLQVNAASHTDNGFVGHEMMARDLVPYILPYWPNQRVKAVATAIGESHLRVGAFNFNQDKYGKDISEDCGVYQINIPAPYNEEFKLRTESTVKAEWEPVVKYNVQYAYSLWSSKTMYREGRLDYRRWQPWVAYTSGWATYPRCWAWHHDQYKQPVGPWVLTGQYLFKSIRGNANYHLIVAKDMTRQRALEWANLQSKYFGAQEGWVNWQYSRTEGIFYSYEDKPTSPPDDGEGYPIKNNGF